MDILGLTHTTFGLGAIIFGAIVVFRPKGTPQHRLLGCLYFASMVALNGTALLIYDLFGGFGPFHWGALFSLATVMAGFVAAFRRRPRGAWIAVHAQFMSWSYVGLMAAAVSEVTSRLPGLPFGWTVATSSLVVFFVGCIIIRRAVPHAIRSVSVRGLRPDQALQK